MHLILYSNSFDPFSTSNDDNDLFLNISTSLMGQQFILRNISLLTTVYDIRSVEIPRNLYSLKDAIRQYLPSINVTYEKSKRVFYDKKEAILDARQLSSTSTVIKKLEYPTSPTLRIPSNSIVYIDKDDKLLIEEIKNPRNFLKAILKILDSEVTSTRISSKAKISKTSVIEGPCIIEKGVVIDDFCKIKGPVYIGEYSFVGMGSLIRNSMIERNTRIGFNCKVGNSYFAGNDKISHHNVISDTIVGQNVWFGGYSGIANVPLGESNAQHEGNNNIVDSELDYFGSVVGNNCCIGASVTILPGRKIPPNSMVQAGTMVKS